uniref:Putative secreted protein n=1 Tax=Anopheles marajoara TaxID=58244 RepID=A0A2M4CEC2_9DIPT
MLCSSSSVFWSIHLKWPVASSSALMVWSTFRSYSGVRQYWAAERAQRDSRTWCEGPKMNTRFTTAGLICR